jgi:hypothetical protein
VFINWFRVSQIFFWKQDRALDKALRIVAVVSLLLGRHDLTRVNKCVGTKPLRSDSKVNEYWLFESGGLRYVQHGSVDHFVLKACEELRVGSSKLNSKLRVSNRSFLNVEE